MTCHCEICAPKEEMLKLPGIRSSLNAVGSYVEETATLAGLSRRRSLNLRMAINELASNIIRQGFEETGAPGELTVKREITGNWVIIVLEDTAIAYNPHAALIGEDPHQVNECGRGLGLFLTLNAVDHFDYERSGGRNRNKFFVRRPVP